MDNTDNKPNTQESTAHVQDVPVKSVRHTKHPLITNEAEVLRLLDAAQGKSYMRTLSVADLIELATWCNDRFDRRHVPRIHRIGTECWITPPAVPNSWKWTNKATVARLRLSRKGWRVELIERRNCWHAAGGGDREFRYELPSRP